MTVLTRHEIKALIEQNQLVFTPPLDLYQDQPHAIDLRLGNTFYLTKTWHMTENGREIINVDFTHDQSKNYEEIQLAPGQYFELAPGEAVIAQTREHMAFRAPDIMGVLYPRSSVNRRGLSVDMTGIVDAHYEGRLMVPIHNRTRQQILRLYPGERIAQLVIERLETPLDRNDALRHGAQTAKYMQSSSPHGKADKEAETEAIRRGNVDTLAS